MLASAEFSIPRAIGKESRTRWWIKELGIDRKMCIRDRVRDGRVSFEGGASARLVGSIKATGLSLIHI